jgi:beta-xylosidase
VLRATSDGWRYVLVCTSDLAPDALVIWRSRDLVRWYADGTVFPAGHQPWWALRSTGRSSGGRYWAPELARIGGRWVVYFAAQLNPRRDPVRVAGEGAVPSEMAIGLAVADRLSGPWRTRLLHVRGRFAGAGEWTRSSPARDGVIDPSIVRDPSDGRLYLFWAVEHDQIWAGALSPDGLTLRAPVRRVLSVTPGWDCDPLSLCIVEAPEPFYRGGRLYLLYSGGLTWNASYAIGAAVAPSADPLDGPYTRIGTRPLMRSGAGWIGPGHSSEPVLGPDGRTYILFHAQRRPSKVSSNRLLLREPLTFNGDTPAIGAGIPSL